MMNGTIAEPVAQISGIRGGGANGSDGDSRKRDSFYWGMPSRVYVTGVLVATCGIAMFFVALASAYLVRKGLAQNDWRAFAFPRILWLNTAILIASSVTAVLAQARQRALDHFGFRHWWFVTTVLGALFLAGQLIAWHKMGDAGLYLGTNPTAGFFYVFTAAHGMHLLVGLAALVFLAVREPKRMLLETATRAAATYWHFLTGLWILLLLFLVYER